MPDLKLPPNQVIVQDVNKNFQWIFDIDNPEEYEFLEKHGEVDKNGNLYLSYPLAIAAARKHRYTPELIQERINNYCEELNLPELQINIDMGKVIEIEDLISAPAPDLERHLIIFGGYKAMLEAQLANLESKKSVLESNFEEGLNKAYYALELKYAEHKRPNKEALRGEALSTYPLLRQTRQQLVEIEGLYKSIQGRMYSMKTMYDSLSRVIALRSGLNNG